MNRQRPLRILFFCTIAVMSIQASESENKMKLLDQEIQESGKKYQAARETLITAQPPQCLAYMNADHTMSQETLKTAVEDFYATQEGQNYGYWQIKIDCLVKMKRYYQEEVRKGDPRASLKAGLQGALFTDNYASTKKAHDINLIIKEELTTFIDTIEPGSQQ